MRMAVVLPKGAHMPPRAQSTNGGVRTPSVVRTEAISPMVSAKKARFGLCCVEFSRARSL